MCWPLKSMSSVSQCVYIWPVIFVKYVIIASTPSILPSSPIKFWVEFILILIRGPRTVDGYCYLWHSHRTEHYSNIVLKRNLHARYFRPMLSLSSQNSCNVGPSRSTRFFSFCFFFFIILFIFQKGIHNLAIQFSRKHSRFVDRRRCLSYCPA